MEFQLFVTRQLRNPNFPIKIIGDEYRCFLRYIFITRTRLQFIVQLEQDRYYLILYTREAANFIYFVYALRYEVPIVFF